MVRLLLARSEVNKSAADGATALMIASEEGHVEVVKLLLAHSDVGYNRRTIHSRLPRGPRLDITWETRASEYGPLLTPPCAQPHTSHCIPW